MEHPCEYVLVDVNEDEQTTNRFDVLKYFLATFHTYVPQTAETISTPFYLHHSHFSIMVKTQ